MNNKVYAHLKDIAIHYPEHILDNHQLAEIYPGWSADKIFEKTGIKKRHIANINETAGDLAYHAAINLFSQGKVKAEEVDFIILCTQAPDYVLPSTACILQNRLKIPSRAGAIDINLGCSGFVYSLSIAKGLIETGAAKCILLLTADTYSKYINPMDKSVRTIFGDAAAATLVVAEVSNDELIGPFVFGTDGGGAKNLIVEAGMFRVPKNSKTSKSIMDEMGNIRAPENLYMSGADVMSFSLKEVPGAINNLLLKAKLNRESIDYFILHQANKFMINALRKKLKINEEKMPIMIEDCGNTVSSSIPIALFKMREANQLVNSQNLMLVGFGVGYSWAACLVKYYKES